MERSLKGKEKRPMTDQKHPLMMKPEPKLELVKLENGGMLVSGLEGSAGAMLENGTMCGEAGADAGSISLADEEKRVRAMKRSAGPDKGLNSAEERMRREVDSNNAAASLADAIRLQPQFDPSVLAGTAPRPLHAQQSSAASSQSPLLLHPAQSPQHHPTSASMFGAIPYQPPPALELAQLSGMSSACGSSSQHHHLLQQAISPSQQMASVISAVGQVRPSRPPFSLPLQCSGK